MIPTITPNNPRADPKISITRIFTKVSCVWASERAQPEPVTPTATLGRKRGGVSFKFIKTKTWKKW